MIFIIVIIIIIQNIRKCNPSQSQAVFLTLGDFVIYFRACSLKKK